MLNPRRIAALTTGACASLLLLAGCQFGPSSSTASPSGSRSATADASASSSPTGSPSPVAPVTADIAAYLLQGTPYVPDSDGEWSGHYGFFTDASHAVACDIYIFSGDSGGLSCAIQPGHEVQRSYPLPAGITTTCADTPGGGYSTDGSALEIDYKIFPDPSNVGFAGCLGGVPLDPTVEAKRIVLPPNTILAVTQTGFETYTCTVANGAASCSDSVPGSSFVFGLAVATFHQG